MDRIQFDFENETVRIQNGEVDVEHPLPGLRRAKGKIMLDAGILMVHSEDMQELLTRLSAGEIDMEEFIRQSHEIFMDAVKSQFHESLN